MYRTIDPLISAALDAQQAKKINQQVNCFTYCPQKPA
jgi:hypothetical protein